MTGRLVITVGSQPGTEVAPELWGLFIEDLNDALDGGLNAECVRNGDFEFNTTDRDGWDALTGWDADQPDRVEVRTDDAVHPNNAHYVRLSGPVTVTNEGWDGVGTADGQSLRFSCFARAEAGPARVNVAVGTGAGDLARAEFTVQPHVSWQRVEADLAAVADGRGLLRIEVAAGTNVDLDCLSLRPVGADGEPLTFRPDLLQALKDLAPSFIRFPGGCVAHGLGLDNLYHWKHTIGPPHERVQIRNLWGYHQSRQIGYLEYFELCEATGATPVPVVAAGVCCQNYSGGAQAVAEAEMDDYVQDVLDLVEFANGGPETPWGAKRADLGHPEPFGLRYLGVGNEDQITDDFRDRYVRIEDAVRKTYPELTVIGTTGPQPFGPDYEAGWVFARERGTVMADEHGYQNPRWFHQNVDRFGTYDRAGPKVYIGEYAARSSTIRSALAEAAYMVGLERYPDMVRLASYAPLLARVGHTQWVPDLIYFTATEVRPSASYYLQQMFSSERGTRLHSVAVEGTEPVPVTIPVTGTAQFRSPGAQVEFTDVMLDGRRLTDTRTGPKSDGVDVGAIDPSSCTLGFTATRRFGEEGFVVVLGGEAPRSFLEVHIGFWQNKSMVVLRSDDAVTSDDHGPLLWRGVRTGEPVRVEVRFTGPRVQVWVDGDLRHDYEQDVRPEHRVVAGVASRPGENGTTEYVLRLVNAEAARRVASVRLPNAPGPVVAAVRTLAGSDPEDGAPHAAFPVVPVESAVAGVVGVELDVPAWSFTTAVIKEAHEAR